MKAFGLTDEQSPAAVIEVPTPEAGPGEVRVRVRASSVNGYDAFVAAGIARGMMEHRYPVVVGKDFAGVIDAVGDGVTRFAVGDEVAGITPPAPHVSDGAYAEYLAELVDYASDVPEAVRAAHPDGVDALILAAHLGEDLGPTAELVKDGGKIASTVGGDFEALAGRGIVATAVYAQSDPAPFGRVLHMAGAGEVVVPIRRTFAFDELPEALGLVGTRSSRGKFAVTISS